MMMKLDAVSAGLRLWVSRHTAQTASPAASKVTVASGLMRESTFALPSTQRVMKKNLRPNFWRFSFMVDIISKIRGLCPRTPGRSKSLRGSAPEPPEDQNLIAPSCNPSGVLLNYWPSRHQERCAKAHPPTEWNTTVVAERRCARKGNMFQKAARLDRRMGGQSIERELPF